MQEEAGVVRATDEEVAAGVSKGDSVDVVVVAARRGEAPLGGEVIEDDAGLRRACGDDGVGRRPRERPDADALSHIRPGLHTHDTRDTHDTHDMHGMPINSYTHAPRIHSHLLVRCLSYV